MPLSQETFPRAIVHFDGDSFFASVEQALNHTLRGEVVIIGAERGAATAISIEGKKLGLARGMSLKEIKERCPEAIVVNSDYTSYIIFARRMYSIARRFTPLVEEYSIDECFADITGLNRVYKQSYEEIARAIQQELHTCLGITFGVGLAPTKVLAKTASKIKKPAGFTAIPANEAHLYLKTLPAGSIWGIGPSMALELSKMGVKTALEFAEKDFEWLRVNNIAKPYRQIWSELRGKSIHRVHGGALDDVGSIQKTRTFYPPSRDPAFIFSQLTKNVERACARARAHHLFAREISFFLKTQEFLYGRREMKLSLSSNDPRVILELIRPEFKTLFRANTLYRATGISLHHFETESSLTHDLFGFQEKAIEEGEVFKAVDSINKRFGLGTVHLASSLTARRHRDKRKIKKNAERPARMHMPGDLMHKTVDLPYLGKVF